MKICKICLENELLCHVCNARLEKGEISRLDLDISRALHALGRGMKRELDFVEAFDTKDFVVIVVSKEHVSKVIGREGRNVKKLSEILGKNVKIVEKEQNKKNYIKSLINVPIIGTNVLYAARGERLRIRVKREHARKIVPSIKHALDKLVGNVEIVFE